MPHLTFVHCVGWLLSLERVNKLYIVYPAIIPWLSRTQTLLELDLYIDKAHVLRALNDCLATGTSLRQLTLLIVTLETGSTTSLDRGQALWVLPSVKYLSLRGFGSSLPSITAPSVTYLETTNIWDLTGLVHLLETCPELETILVVALNASVRQVNARLNFPAPLTRLLRLLSQGGLLRLRRIYMGDTWCFPIETLVALRFCPQLEVVHLYLERFPFELPRFCCMTLFATNWENLLHMELSSCEHLGLPTDPTTAEAGVKLGLLRQQLVEEWYAKTPGSSDAKYGSALLSLRISARLLEQFFWLVSTSSSSSPKKQAVAFPELERLTVIADPKTEEHSGGINMTTVLLHPTRFFPKLKKLSLE